MTRPPDLKEVEDEIKRLDKEKEEAVASQDFERAAKLRDQAYRLRKKKEQQQREWREQNKEVDGVVDDEVIAETVSKMTGVPLTRLEQGEAERLLKMEDEIHKMVISQHNAVSAIAKALRRSRAGLKDPRRPMGSFIFVGPTGVGKTLLAKALARFMFGSEDALMHIDMSEYMEKHSVSRLVGAPPGYVGFEEGGQLTEKVRRRPYAVVLFDEIEKAHHDVFNMLLQIMEEGRLTDSFGRHVDFRNTILIMTSNVGAHMLKNQAALGFQSTSTDVSYDKMKEALMREVEREFRPEFLNRLDDVIVFKPLDRNDLANIVGIELQGVTGRLADVNVELVVSEEAKEWLIDKGYNPDYGARPLRRAVEQNVEDPMAEEVLRGAFAERSKVTVVVKDGELAFQAEAAPEPPEPVGVAAGGDGESAEGPDAAESTPDAT